MTSTFGSNPDFQIEEPVDKPQRNGKSKSHRINKFTCAKCRGVGDSLIARQVITDFDDNNMKHTDYYHAKCSPLKPKSFTEKLLGLFTRS